MKQEVISGLEQIAEDEFNKIKENGIDENSGYKGFLETLSATNKIIRDEKVYIFNQKIEKDKLRFEKKKFDEEFRLKEYLEVERIKLEHRKLDIEEEKIKLESLRRIEQEQNRLKEEKNARREKMINVGVGFTKFMISMAIFAGCHFLEMKLTYKDDGIVPTKNKVFLDHILKGYEKN